MNKVIEFEYKLKSLIALKGLNLTKIVNIINQSKDLNYSVANLSQKIKRGTITYFEVVNILEVLKLEITFTDIK